MHKVHFSFLIILLLGPHFLVGPNYGFTEKIIDYETSTFYKNIFYGLQTTSSMVVMGVAFNQLFNRSLSGMEWFIFLGTVCTVFDGMQHLIHLNFHNRKQRYFINTPNL
jgi:hypothetical protein